MIDVLSGWRRLLRLTFSGQSEGVPQWELDLAKGDDGGFFGPSSATWAVHGGMSPIVAGIRALLIQALHPGALAGVYEFSRFREDPLGRLAGTIRWIFTVTYGDTAAAKGGSDYVRRLHERVQGTYQRADGAVLPYSANDPELLAWVHMAFAESFLTAHQVWGGGIPGGADAYVREWSAAAELMQVPEPPRSEAQLRAAMDSLLDEGVLCGGPRVEEVVRFIRRPPLHPALLPGYRVLFEGAVATIDPRYRRLLGLEPAHVGPLRLPAVGAAKAVLAAIGVVLQKQGPSELSARARRRRLGLDG
ncbi:DUF2236 domain-containing protein [Paenarthrobacter sp. DKR-5]|uniref:oxygenase MpaB family protein n=1 Tax=Paenarthrobacter sp. DKR-5 TaxID=2835535 RepID=UPI001BDCD9CD|nr:oxygenase MpaB family protein [Paenarthrobacter sp. DKR-5]MBT1001148.1 DUF2236 domain-containing protein [Paenarthrobacter sp. DKR-5]